MTQVQVQEGTQSDGRQLNHSGFEVALVRGDEGREGCGGL